MQRPAANEYVEYYDRYVSKVPAGSITEILRRQMADSTALLGSIGEAKALHRYAPDKWSIKQLVGHMIDTERVFSYRALAFARADRNPLPGFEQDDWVRASGTEQRTLVQLAAELEAVRESTVLMFDGFDEATSLRTGSASGRSFTVRSIAYVIAGHELHHREVLQARYL